MDNKFYVPNTIKVGFNYRNDTYTGKLAYVVYFDNKGVLRKEKSWEDWRNKEINAEEYQNVPTDGFVLNKSVGGARQSWGYNARNEYVRIYDPRGFEFEISIPNLLFILRECDCTRGKGLEGQFVYAWDQNNLILLPVNSQEYKDSVNYTALQSKSIKKKDLVQGGIYLNKKNKELIYICESNKKFNNSKQKLETDKKYLVFWYEDDFLFLKDTKQLAEQKDSTIDPDQLIELINSFNDSIHNSKIKELFIKQTNEKSPYYYYSHEEIKPGVFLLRHINSHCNRKNVNYVTKYAHIHLCNDGTVKVDHLGYRSNGAYENKDYPENELWIRLESGKEYRTFNGIIYFKETKIIHRLG